MYNDNNPYHGALDPKQKILFALYADYLRPIPSPANISADNLLLSEEIFLAAIDKLWNEELIKIGDGYSGQSDLRRIKPSLKGIQYVEESITVLYTAPEFIKTIHLCQRAQTNNWGLIKDIAEQSKNEHLAYWSKKP